MNIPEFPLPPANSISYRFSAACSKRGIVLLLVLSLLSLFAILAAAVVLQSQRAHRAALANRRALHSRPLLDSPRNAKSFLNNVLMQVLRDERGNNFWHQPRRLVIDYAETTKPYFRSISPEEALTSRQAYFESLLGDVYGYDTLVGKATQIAVTNIGDDPVGHISALITPIPQRRGVPANLSANFDLDGSGNAWEVTGFSSGFSSTDGLWPFSQDPHTNRYGDLLVGRILSFVDDNRSASSHRIMSATKIEADSGETQYRVTVGPAHGGRPFFVPPNNACRVVINGRDFSGRSEKTQIETPDKVIPTNEAWDGYDNANLFIARVEPDPASPFLTKVSRPSYLPLAFSEPSIRPEDLCDNDGDGVVDSIFIDFFGTTPDQYDSYDGYRRLFHDSANASGISVQVSAAVLVVPLDGNFNVNLHGSSLPVLFHRNHPGWPSALEEDTGLTGNAIADIPVGSGYGVAEIQPFAAFGFMGPEETFSFGAERLFPQTARSVNENILLKLFLGSTHLSARRLNGGPYGITTSGQLPNVAPSVLAAEGRYGEFPAPPITPLTAASFGLSTAAYPVAGLPAGTLASRAQATRTMDPSASDGIPDVWFNPPDGHSRAAYNSPPDLFGIMKTSTLAAGQGSELPSSVSPSLVFIKPDWTKEIAGNPYSNAFLQPNLFTGLPRSPIGQPDNPFTYAELEAVLRPYDTDTACLPQRLVALLGSAANEARGRITTAGFDTTLIVGDERRSVTEEGEPVTRSGAYSALRSFISTITPDETVFASRAGDSRFPGIPAELTGVFANELARGERLNLNRALTPTLAGEYDITKLYWTQRAAFAKDLYILACALSGLTEAESEDESLRLAKRQQLAQWAINVVDYSDADSVMTPFEFDMTPENGWDVDGDVTTNGPAERDRGIVWGAERPEALILETAAWEAAPPAGIAGDPSGGVYFALHRPWRSNAFSGGGSTPAETIDPRLESSNAPLSNKCDFSLTSKGDFPLPVWRVRFEGFDDIGQPAGAPAFAIFVAGHYDALSPPPIEPTATGDINVGVDDWLIVGSSNPLNRPAAAPIFQRSVDYSSARVPGSPPVIQGGSWPMPRHGRMFLERLSRPDALISTIEYRNEIWANTTAVDNSLSAVRYIVVDQAPIRITNRSDIPPGSYDLERRANRKLTRKTGSGRKAFWATDDFAALGSNFQETIGDLITFEPPPPLDTAWMPWPNRPLISPAEIFLVPPGRQIEVLTSYRRIEGGPTPEESASTSPVPADLLLDAVHVPTRFPFAHLTVTADTDVSPAAVFKSVTPINQYSSYREPGRININLISSDDIWESVVAGSMPGCPRGRTRDVVRFFEEPAKSMAEALALAPPAQRNDRATGLPFFDEAAVAMPTTRNPLHGAYTANRLSNSVTIRSNVFAIWITARFRLRNDPTVERFHRGFAIVDRSIPVAFELGKDHNVRDCVMLWRVIE